MGGKLEPSTLEVEAITDQDYSAAAICLNVIGRAHTTYLAGRVHDGLCVIDPYGWNRVVDTEALVLSCAWSYTVATVSDEGSALGRGSTCGIRRPAGD